MPAVQLKAEETVMRQLLAAVGVLIVAVGMGWLIHRRIVDSRIPVRSDRDRPVPVEVTPVQRGTLYDDRAFRGTLVARSQFVIAPKVPGRLVNLAVDIGDTVRRGDLIAVLDSEEYAHQVEQVRAELAVSQASLEDAESKLAVAASDLRRIRELHRERVASDANLEETEARKRTAEAQVKLAEAQIRQRQAALRAAEVRLAYTRLYAEWDETRGDTWLVAERFVDEGTMLRANDPVVSVVDTGTLRAVVHAVERDFPGIAPGQPAFIRTDAYPGERFDGRVVRRAPILDEGSRHARVEIEVENSDGRLAPGMFARVHIRLDERRDVHVIPQSALARRNQTEGVFRIDHETMTARYIDVTTGIRGDGMIELVSPELAGDVVTLGHHLLEDGSAVVLPGADPRSAPHETPSHGAARMQGAPGGRQ